MVNRVLRLLVRLHRPEEALDLERCREVPYLVREKTQPLRLRLRKIMII